MNAGRECSVSGCREPEAVVLKAPIGLLTMTVGLCLVHGAKALTGDDRVRVVDQPAD